MQPESAAPPPDTENPGGSVVDASAPTGTDGSGDASAGDSAFTQNPDSSASGDAGATTPDDGAAPPPTDAEAEGGDADGDAHDDDAGDAAVDGGDALGEGD